MNEENKKVLFIGESRGIHIPKTFVQYVEDSIPGYWMNMSIWIMAILRIGPDHPDYWEAWDDALANSYYLDNFGKRWTLHQDGDVWLIHEDYDWEKEEA